MVAMIVMREGGGRRPVVPADAIVDAFEDPLANTKRSDGGGRKTESSLAGFFEINKV